MTEKEHDIQVLREQTARQRKLTSVLQSLENRRAELQARVNELARVRAAEQADVDRLERGSLASFFYAMTGQKEERLDKEQQEAYAAAVKHDAAVRELESVNYDLRRVRGELDSLSGCEERLRLAIEGRLEELKYSGTPEGADIMELEKKAAQNTAGQKEVREAIEAGETALYTVDSVLQSLDSAEGWGTWDLFSGSILTDIIKHDHLNDAQAMIEQLQIDLRRFHTELADTEIYADMNVRIEGFLQFADFFFDGLFADWAVLDRIKDSKEQVETVRWQIEDTLVRLRGILSDMETESRDIRARLDRLANANI